MAGIICIQKRRDSTIISQKVTFNRRMFPAVSTCFGLFSGFGRYDLLFVWVFVSSSMSSIDANTWNNHAVTPFLDANDACHHEK